MSDDFEARLREALGRPAADPLDSEAFLTQVHRGARVRRVRRTVAGVAAAALVVVGGGAVLQTSGLLSGNQTPAAGRGPKASGGIFTHRPDGPTTAKSAAKTKPLKNMKSEPHTSAPTPVTLGADGTVSSADYDALSLTATGTEHQWVLALTPGRICGDPHGCASILYRESGVWADLGHLPAPPASPDDPTAQSVSQLRFVKQADGTYDGWAYGGSLWSTHSSGATWVRVDAVSGEVTQLEGWGDSVYAAATQPRSGRAYLYRSPTSRDDWQRVDIGYRLHTVEALAAAKGIVGLIDGHGLNTSLLLKVGDARWSRAVGECPSGMSPQSLSTASDPTSSEGSLWVTCSDGVNAAVEVTDTRDGRAGGWQLAETGSLDLAADVVVAARSPQEAVVVGGGVKGAAEVSPTAAPQSLAVQASGTPLYLGFTNSTTGYLLTDGGRILATTDGGDNWSPLDITTP